MQSIQRIELIASNIAREFQRRRIFREVSFTLTVGQVMGITGRNGSGKTTLMKIIAGVLAASSGSVRLFLDGKIIETEQYYRSIGYVSPYLALYEEFSPLEHLQLSARLRGITFDTSQAYHLLSSLQLYHRRADRISSFSSGMKQRMKYILALQHAPTLLLLDEPMTNLDTEGVALVEQIIHEHRSRGSSIIATNDERDIALCDYTIPIIPS